MKETFCGVCNFQININHCQIIRKENDHSITFYHASCEDKASKLKPCVDCGYHKALCTECAEL